MNGHVAVVGATGVVGGELLASLAERGHPADRVSAYASERSVGEEVEYGGEMLEVEVLSPEAFQNRAVVFLACPPSVATELASRAQAAGAWVIDAGSLFRDRPEVTLAWPGRPAKPPAKGRILRCASPVAAALSRLVEPLRADPGVVGVHLTALLAAGASGKAGVQELEQQTASLMSGRDPDPQRFPHRLAFNVIPQVGSFRPDGFTTEESAWGAELSQLWPDAPWALGTALQVPSFFGHELLVDLTLARPLAPDAARERLGKAPGLKVVDAPQDRVYPMPMLVAADASIHVGRLRAGPADRLLGALAFEGARLVASAALDAAESLLASAA